MFEQLLANIQNPSGPIVRTDALFIDMATLKETHSNYPVTVANNAATDNVYLINGKPTLSLPTAGASGSRLSVNTSSPILNAGYDWSLDWTTYYNSSPVVWTNEIYLADSTLSKGITVRWGNTGYGNLLMFADNNNAGAGIRSECRFNILPVDVAQKLVRWTLSCDPLGRVRLYMNGNLVNAIPGAAGSTEVPYYQSGPTSNYNNLTVMYVGALNANANNVARKVGNIRLSRPAITAASFTPDVF